MATAQRSGSRSGRALTREEKGTVVRLGLPTFGLALAITVVTTYTPLLAKRFTSSTTVIGLVIGAEGLVALVVPLAAGAWSDQLRTPIGGRLPFLLVGAPVIAVSVALIGFLGSLWLIALVLVVFFTAYYAAYEPYRALYPDLLRAEVAGRGQSVQAIFRGFATGTALIGGGLLFTVSPKLPFIACAVLALVTMLEFVRALKGSPEVRKQERHGPRSAREALAAMLGLLRRRPALRAFLFANALWELALAALKTFVVLFLTAGLGMKMTSAVAVIGVVVVLVLIAAPVSGKLGDRYGKARVVRMSLWVFGFGLLVPFVTQAPYVVVPVLPFVAFGGGMILTLPYAVLMPLMPEDEHGLVTGFYSFSRGLGIVAGPLLAGLAITLLRGSLHGSHGYAAMWLVCALAILASLPFMGTLERREKRARAERRRSGD